MKQSSVEAAGFSDGDVSQAEETGADHLITEELIKDNLMRDCI